MKITFLALIFLLLPISSALSATDGFYSLAETAFSWDGTDANRTSKPTADYDYTYGDESTVSYTLPWSFTFYGQIFTTINSDTNGNIWFSGTGTASSFNLPTFGRGPVIAAWNNDLSSNYLGGTFIQHKTNPERVVIQWQTETYTEEGYLLPNDVEVVLFPNGNIRMDYKSFTSGYAKDFGSGVSKDDGQHYLNISSTFGNVTTLSGHSFFFTLVQSTATSTIWPDSTVPVIIDSGADSLVELGVKFSSDIGGYITGIRFYKSALNNGVHEGHLWSATGTLLATATFVNETASGWQQANFPIPVAISRGGSYVASYHTNVGHYSDDFDYFAGKGYDNPPLHAQASTLSSLNGVFAYGATSRCPDQSWKNSNYWVDVVFSSTLTPQTTLTSVVIEPANVTVSVGSSAQFKATGTYADGTKKEITAEAKWSSSDSATATITSGGLVTGITQGTSSITASVGNVSGTVLLTVELLSLTIDTTTLPSAKKGASYSSRLVPRGGMPPYLWSVVTGTLPKGCALDTATGIISGTPTASGVSTVTFQVYDSSNPRQTASRSMLLSVNGEGLVAIITSPLNPFSSYYAEILKAEGLALFDLLDVSAVTGGALSGYDLAVLGEMPLSEAQVTEFTDWVNNGGRLVAMRPDKKLAALLGIIDHSTSLAEGYLLIDTASGPGTGLANETLQYHGPADLYTLNGATSIATLYSTSTSKTTSPAITFRTVGTKSGQAAAFAYDLARSVVLTRQGNPAWAGQKRDGFAVVRPDDLFFGAAAFDNQKDWVDLDKVGIPQADEQQRLLVKLILKMAEDRKPLPRFGYLPKNVQAAVVITGADRGGDGGTTSVFDGINALSKAGCSVENWECIRGTSYLAYGSLLSDVQASMYAGVGFEVGMELETGCQDWTPSSLDSLFTSQLAAWSTRFPTLPRPVTLRTRCVPWSDYSSMPEIEARHGIRLDTNYYYWPPGWVSDRPGYFTGSGLPMHFADAAGNLIDVYQVPTQLTDESGQSYPYSIDALLDKATGPEGYWGVFTVNQTKVSSRLRDVVVKSAVARGIPVVSAQQLLTWLDTRYFSSFESVSWSDNMLTFTVVTGGGAKGLTAIIPVASGQAVTKVVSNGTSIPFNYRRMKGDSYIEFLAEAGNYAVSFAPTADSTPPSVLTVEPLPGKPGVPVGSQVSVTFSKDMIPSSVSAASFELRAGNVIVPSSIIYEATSRTAILTPATPLRYLTDYTASVKGGSGGVRDSASLPVAEDYTWTFTTEAGSTKTYSLWPETATPAIVDTGHDNPVVLGVRFSSDKPGYITGVRFYKSSANTGVHVAELWAGTGTLLAAATFSQETASGWQQVNFPEPVAITAKETYVASYHTNVGHYSDTIYFFASNGVDSLLLHAPAEGNGVFAYGASGTFPNQSWNNSNYWVDVIFVESSGPGSLSQTVTPLRRQVIGYGKLSDRIPAKQVLRSARIGSRETVSRRDKHAVMACAVCHNDPKKVRIKKAPATKDRSHEHRPQKRAGLARSHSKQATTPVGR